MYLVYANAENDDTQVSDLAMYPPKIIRTKKELIKSFSDFICCHWVGLNATLCKYKDMWQFNWSKKDVISAEELIEMGLVVYELSHCEINLPETDQLIEKIHLNEPQEVELSGLANEKMKAERLQKIINEVCKEHGYWWWI